MQRPAYVLASTYDLSARTDVLPTATTYYEAKTALAGYLLEHPDERDDIQLLAAHEAVPA